VTPISVTCQTWFTAGLAIADCVVLSIALIMACTFPAHREWPVLLAGVGAAVSLQSAGFAFGIYDLSTAAAPRRGAWSVLWFGLFALIVALLCVLGSAGAATAKAVAPIGLVALPVPVLLRGFVAAWCDRHISAIAERVLLIGSPEGVARLLATDRPTDVAERFVDVIAIGDEQPSPIEVLTVLTQQGGDPDGAVEDFRRINEALRSIKGKIDRVVIVPAGLDEATLVATLNRVEHLPFEITLAPPAVMLINAVDPLGRSNCIVLRRAAMTQWGFVRKRALDILVASALLIVLAPVFLLIAMLIRLGSPGPALFRQARWGWNNQPFVVYKFRTMWSDAASSDGSVQATRGDRRITPIGAFLRSSSLDELPQLLNVLNGTMSLVGPRPHPVDLNLRCLGLIARYACRHRVMPGITGLAQINGFRGETFLRCAMQRRVDLDIEYIRTRSLGTDIAILFKTVGTVIRGKNAY